MNNIYGQATSFHNKPHSLASDKNNSENADDEVVLIEAPEAEILIVDDNLVNIKVAEGLLKLCGIKPDITQSGKEAIEKINKKLYDIVLMDHLMPEMDGIETTAAIRKSGYSERELIIIALSANIADGARQMFLDCGMQDFLMKPIEKAALNGILKKWLPKEKIIDPSTELEKKRGIVERLRRIEALEIDTGLGKAGGDFESYEHSVVVLSKNAPPIVSILSVCDNLKKIESLTRGTQVLLDNAGAALMSERAGVLNQAASRGDIDLCRENLPGFLEELKMLCQQISEILKSD